jgi:hypothetical protein
MSNSSHKESNQNKNNDDKMSCASWGGLLGIVLGIVIGLFTRHWVAFAFSIGAIGYVIGAAIDRNRR